MVQNPLYLKSGGRYYKLSSYGDYVPTTQAGYKAAYRAGKKDKSRFSFGVASSLPDFYYKQGEDLYGSAYQPQIQQTQGYYDTLRDKFTQRLRGEYGKRGFLNSGLYGQEWARGDTALNQQEASSVGEIMSNKQDKIVSYVDSMIQRAVNAGDTRSARKWEAYKRQLEIDLAGG